jgi:hypothetical protein
MIIVYKMIHRNHQKPIELCGMFRDMKHFEMFRKVEEFRGWYVSGFPVILQ